MVASPRREVAGRELSPVGPRRCNLSLGELSPVLHALALRCHNRVSPRVCDFIYPDKNLCGDHRAHTGARREGNVAQKRGSARPRFRTPGAGEGAPAGEALSISGLFFPSLRKTKSNHSAFIFSMGPKREGRRLWRLNALGRCVRMACVCLVAAHD